MKGKLMKNINRYLRVSEEGGLWYSGDNEGKCV